ncbi:hypothetical protein CPS_0351 [Colwellia psychrerythraea 34H]|uniref:Uncharacterized protein n=1 Tax=Colwellia psychrerythraea (strain 34H / ATCC BAA-681) TaxID=167879 RepID=Q48A05_COLP3|nr:hypothetical protein CPS_0351 [Colwellia psychrerythraea 34H]
MPKVSLKKPVAYATGFLRSRDQSTYDQYLKVKL